MRKTPNTIIVKVLYDNEEHVLTTYNGEYRNLMALIYDKIYIDGFGDCKGMGRCATCLVEIIESGEEIPMSERNEEATIKKTGIVNPSVRMACQLLVDHLLHNIKIKIWQW